MNKHAQALGFNPRPPRLEGATPRLPFSQTPGLFQSAPPPLGGGDAAVAAAHAERRCFNPRPPRLEGATNLRQAAHLQAFVSIRAPPAWRGRHSPESPQ